jgi:predicted RNA-binding protein with PIN domain
MAEYQGYSGYRVIIVFDAHYVQGNEKKYKNHRIEVIFTKENESADERIEKMAIRLNSRTTQIHVATSDYTEQWAIFGQGALRISARELLTEMNEVENKINKRVKKIQEKRPFSKIPLSDEVAEIFEKWRRGDK